MNMDFGSVMISPSTIFYAGWEEGYDLYYNTTPYRTGHLKLIPRRESNITMFSSYILRVYSNNGIGAYCGFPSSEKTDGYFLSNDVFYITTNTSNITYPIATFPGVGVGCSKFKSCSGHGRCDYCYEKCMCDDGYGSANDIVHIGRDLDGTCSHRKYAISFHRPSFKTCSI